jgi:hypothetical protein
MDASSRVVVDPPASGGGGRRVRVGSVPLGVAHGEADLYEFLRRAGLEPEDVALDDPTLFEWRGGGPEVW